MAGSSASTLAEVSSGLAEGVGNTPMNVPGWPLKFTIISVLSAASSIRAASRSLIVRRRVVWITSIPVSSSLRRFSDSSSCDCITEICVSAELNRS